MSKLTAILMALTSMVWSTPTGNSRRAPAALLAVAGPAGWLRIYQASQAGPLSWQLLHSSHGSVAAPITALAFTPHGDTLAVAGPAAQVLGTDAVAVAAAGGQPGAVSLYMVDGGAGVQQELQLWQQWALRSLPVGLVVLPSTHVDLMKGKQLEPTQVCFFLGACMSCLLLQQHILHCVNGLFSLP